jgi:hypothetical protein
VATGDALPSVYVPKCQGCDKGDLLITAVDPAYSWVECLRCRAVMVIPFADHLRPEIIHDD